MIMRTRSNYGPPLYQALTMPLILVGGEIFTARKMLYGIKRRAERAVKGLRLTSTLTPESRRPRRETFMPDTPVRPGLS
jgi:hypothetical protein